MESEEKRYGIFINGRNDGVECIINPISWDEETKDAEKSLSRTRFLVGGYTGLVDCTELDLLENGYRLDLWHADDFEGMKSGFVLWGENNSWRFSCGGHGLLLLSDRNGESVGMAAKQANEIIRRVAYDWKIAFWRKFEEGGAFLSNMLSIRFLPE